MLLVARMHIRFNCKALQDLTRTNFENLNRGTPTTASLLKATVNNSGTICKLHRVPYKEHCGEEHQRWRSLRCDGGTKLFFQPYSS